MDYIEGRLKASGLAEDVAHIPYADLLMAVFRRARAGLSPFAPDRKHLHHRMLEIGHSHQTSVLIMYLWAAVFAGSVVWLSIVRTPLVVLVIITVGAMLALLFASMPRLRPWARHTAGTSATGVSTVPSSPAEPPTPPATTAPATGEPASRQAAVPSAAPPAPARHAPAPRHQAPARHAAPAPHDVPAPVHQASVPAQQAPAPVNHDPATVHHTPGPSWDGSEAQPSASSPSWPPAPPALAVATDAARP